MLIVGLGVRVLSFWLNLVLKKLVCCTMDVAAEFECIQSIVAVAGV